MRDARTIKIPVSHLTETSKIYNQLAHKGARDPVQRTPGMRDLSSSNRVESLLGANNFMVTSSNETRSQDLELFSGLDEKASRRNPSYNLLAIACPKVKA